MKILYLTPNILHHPNTTLQTGFLSDIGQLTKLESKDYSNLRPYLLSSLCSTKYQTNSSTNSTRTFLKQYLMVLFKTVSILHRRIPMSIMFTIYTLCTCNSRPGLLRMSILIRYLLLVSNPKFHTMSLSVTSGANSCHVPQCIGSSFKDSTSISTASFIKSSFFNTTP